MLEGEEVYIPNILEFFQALALRFSDSVPHDEKEDVFLFQVVCGLEQRVKGLEGAYVASEDGEEGVSDAEVLARLKTFFRLYGSEGAPRWYDGDFFLRDASAGNGLLHIFTEDNDAVGTFKDTQVPLSPAGAESFREGETPAEGEHFGINVLWGVEKGGIGVAGYGEGDGREEGRVMEAENGIRWGVSGKALCEALSAQEKVGVACHSFREGVAP